jgi:hypothetical protein
MLNSMMLNVVILSVMPFFLANEIINKIKKILGTKLLNLAFCNHQFYAV